MSFRDDPAGTVQESEDIEKDLEELKGAALLQSLIDPEKEDAILLVKLNRATEIVNRSNLLKHLYSNQNDGIVLATLVAAVLAKMK